MNVPKITILVQGDPFGPRIPKKVFLDEIEVPAVQTACLEVEPNDAMAAILRILVSDVDIITADQPRAGVRDLAPNQLEIGLTTDQREVVMNHPEMTPNPGFRGGHIVFSPEQARNLAALLIRKANECVGQEAAQSRESLPCTCPDETTDHLPECPRFEIHQRSRDSGSL